MPEFLEKKLKQEYGANSKTPYKVMNKLGYMRGNKETAAGKAAQRKHDRKRSSKGRTYTPVIFILLALIILVISSPAASHLFGALDAINNWTGATNTFVAISASQMTDSGLTINSVVCTDGTNKLTSTCPGGGSITGSGTATKLALFNSSSSLVASNFFIDDGGFGSICYPAGGCSSGPFLQVGASIATGGISMSGQDIVIKAFGTGSGNGNIFLRHGVGSRVEIGGLAGVTPLVRFVGQTSGQLDLTVDATISNTPIFNLTHMFQDCQTGTTCTPITNSDPRVLKLRVILSGGTATISSISPVFHSSSSAICYTNDVTTPANTSRANEASTSSITVTGTGTDVISVGCID